MPILSGAEADGELKKVTPVKDYAIGPGGYPYTRHSDEDFERLCYALFKSSKPAGLDKRFWDDASLMVRGADAGRDLVLSANGCIAGVVQCKRLESSISLPAVFKEVAKLILYPEVDRTLPEISAGISYFLALARDPAKTVVDFFARPAEVLGKRRGDVETSVRDVLESYETLGGLKEPEAQAKVWALLPKLSFKLVRPVDLDEWMSREPAVASRFFPHRTVVDSSEVVDNQVVILAELALLRNQLGGVPLLTDVDLKIIKEHIEGTPETHRVAVGFASCFGYPREMFAGNENLRQRVGRLAQVINEVNADYSEWMFARAREEASRICDLGEVIWRVHPFAKQLAGAFLSSVTADVVGKSISGEVMDGIVAKVTGRKRHSDDGERIADLREALFESGKRYLAGDFSQVAGEGEILELKMQVITHLMHGISDAASLERLLADGEKALRPHLDEAAVRLRGLCAKRPSIFLMGTPGIDNPEVLARMAETVRALDLLGKNAAKPL